MRTNKQAFHPLGRQVKQTGHSEVRLGALANLKIVPSAADRAACIFRWAFHVFHTVQWHVRVAIATAPVLPETVRPDEQIGTDSLLGDWRSSRSPQGTRPQQEEQVTESCDAQLNWRVWKWRLKLCVCVWRGAELTHVYELEENTRPCLSFVCICVLSEARGGHRASCSTTLTLFPSPPKDPVFTRTWTSCFSARLLGQASLSNSPASVPLPQCLGYRFHP